MADFGSLLENRSAPVAGVALAWRYQGRVGAGERERLPLGLDGLQSQVGYSPVDDDYRQDAGLTHFYMLKIQTYFRERGDRQRRRQPRPPQRQPHAGRVQVGGDDDESVV